MKRKLTIIITSILVLFLVGIVICLFINNKNNDGKKFKNEYYYIEIDKKNPFIYKTAEDIINMINDKETFAVYFGYPESEEVKKELPSLIKAVLDEKLETIYYVNIQNIRNEMVVNNGNIETSKMGTANYYELLKLLDELLPNYIIKDSKDKEYKAGKRIEAPTLLVVSSGEPLKTVSSNYEDFKKALELIKPSNMCEENTAC